ncbi:Vacuolar protein sorting-associated protein atg6 [Conoideocrella luteorostrata]|uniref:Vacuolar protein sorting-associated protein atg6 n=1 Tax=Conoideocrella luteorostrata TaxID=1105319 RepID=A0AAJ0CNH3_9HYPO|nr:Vacuolar protein sorting-associated protein atg6 [Conoideocrella luteorostrata]
MGWFPSIFGSEKPSDPLGKLDPKLREFLEKESPVKYTSNQTLVTSKSPPPGAQIHHAQKPDEPAIDKSTVPSASLYQDGRYAHLWKNYRPLEQIESEAATDHDKLMTVLEGFKERKAAIGRAALENCALQQEEWVNCMKNGSWEDQLQMCRHQVRRFERCYTMQSRFLRALGYGSVAGRPARVDEDIQMHADTLYERMLDHEAAVEQAKKDGTPVPPFDPALPKASAPKVTPTDELEKQWREKLDKLPEDERVVEEAALRADLQAKSDVASSVKQIWASQKEERDARKAGGGSTFTDTLNGLFSRNGNEGKK